MVFGVHLLQITALVADITQTKVKHPIPSIIHKNAIVSSCRGFNDFAHVCEHKGRLETLCIWYLLQECKSVRHTII